MPAKVLPSEEKFGFFEKYMLREGFRRLTRGEFATSHERLGLEAPRPRRGREVGFAFSANGLDVFVWTTFIAEEGRAREEDAGWVGIVEGDKPKYYSHPVMRTEGFLRKLFRLAKIAKERVLKRPLCLTCKAYMKIARGRHLKQRYWECNGKSRPHHTQALPWDYGLSDESVVFLEAERKERRRYRANLAKVGKEAIRAMLKRKPWVVRNPQNII